MKTSQVVTLFVAALVHLAVPGALWLITGRSLGAGERRLRYSMVARLFAILVSALPTAAVCLAVTQQSTPLRPSDWRGVAALLLLFPIVGGSLVLEFIRVVHEYDDAGWSYRSPWSLHRRVSWAEIERIEWRSSLKWLDFVPVTGARLHVSPLLSGLDEFARLALVRLPSYALAKDPEALAALKLMAHGAGGRLLREGRSPSAILDEIAPTARR